MFSFRKLAIAAVGIFVLAAFPVYPFATLFAQVTVNVDYNDVIVPQINRLIFGMSVVHNAFADPDSEPDGYALYVDLAEQSGVTHLHIPSSAYWSHYNWLTGIAKVYDEPVPGYSIDEPVQGYSIADWKRFSDDTDVGIMGIISPHLYYSRYGGEDPGAVLQWCIDNNWDPEKWRYWAIGSECYGDWDRDYVADVNEYCAMVNEISPRMKSVAPDIKIGVPFEIIWRPDWCQAVLEQCGDNIDFVDFHWYPHGHNGGYLDPYGTMQHYPWLERKLLPALQSHFDNYLDGRRLEIFIGEYDFWGGDSYFPPVRRNTTLADALAWGDFFGQAIRLGIDMATGYDFSGTSSYALLLWWEELQHLPIKYSPKTWVLGMWSKYFGQSMASATVEGSPNYITHDGRQEWANVDCCSWDEPPYSTYTAVPVDYVTAYAGIDSINNKASLILINKHNDSSYVLGITLSGLTIDGAESTHIYTLTTESDSGLMAANRQWDPTPMEIEAPTYTTMVVGNSFNFTLGPHSMVTMRFPLTSAEDAMAPAAVTDLAASDPTSNSITLGWTAPGDNGESGTASQYNIRYMTAPITEADWSSATQVSGEPKPQAAGTSQSMTVSGLDPSTIYYFAIKTADEVPNWSVLSNVASVTTQEERTNQPPYFDPSTSDQSTNEGDNLTFAVVATDPDGDTIILTVSDLPKDATFTDNGGGNGTFGWTPDYADAGEFLVTFHASDQINPLVDDQVTIMVNDADTTPPVISSISAIEITRHQAAIGWNTDEVATSLVEYGLSPSYGSSTSPDTNLVTEHLRLLTRLHLDTAYYFRVKSKDAVDNEAVSQDYVFRTAARPRSPRPVNPPDDTTLGVPNPDLVILNGIDSLGFHLAHLFQIDTTIEFNSLNLQQSIPFALDCVDDSMTLWTVPQELTPGAYYWRAYAYTNIFPSDTSDPSEIFSFRITSADVTDTTYQLTLEYPLPNDTIPTLRPTLVARLVSGSLEMNLLSCEFEVSEDPHFSNNVLSSESIKFSADGTARWQVTSDLKQNAKFYWRARLCSQNGVLDITQRWTMFTGAIHVYPNPFKPSLGHSHVTFRNVPVNSTIRVTTISGDLVKTFDGTQQTDIVWDVKSQDQTESASGVYLYWVTHGREVSSGKIFVIR